MLEETAQELQPRIARSARGATLFAARLAFFRTVTRIGHHYSELVRRTAVRWQMRRRLASSAPQP
jgi:hypothetical protein